MPISYYIVTNEKVSELVDTTNLQELDSYLLTGGDTEEERLYHILSYATNISNLVVLKYFSDKINTSYVPDGNAYNLIHLAIETYVENYEKDSRIIRFETVLLLVAAQLKNHGNIKNIMLRDLISLGNTHNNYELLEILAKHYHVTLWDVYHYSIAWNVPKVFDKLIAELIEFIDFEWTETAIDIAYGFDHDEIVVYVLDTFKEFLPEIYEKYKHLYRSKEYIIKDANAVIPDHITTILTAADFCGSIDNIKLPSKLERIEFGPRFNQLLDNVVFPETVTTITFGIHHNWSMFDKSIKNIKLPKALKKYYNQGGGCDESIEDVVFPDTLEVLSLGYKFNYSLDKVNLPKSLKKLVLHCNFDQSLANVKFPVSFDTLEFYQMKTDLAMNTITHPITTINLICPYKDISNLPQSLKYIGYGSECDKIHVKGKLPEGCIFVKI